MYLQSQENKETPTGAQTTPEAPVAHLCNQEATKLVTWAV